MGPRTRRLTQLSSLFLALGALSTLGPPAAAESPPPASAPRPETRVRAVRGIEVVVGDLVRAREFYEQLGFTAAERDELRGAEALAHTGMPNAHVERQAMALGSERLVLLHFVAPADGRPMPPDTRGNDLWFQHIAIVVHDMDRAYGWLRALRVPHVSSAPQTLPRSLPAAAGISAFYFNDPDGHVLEIIHFPAGKGDPRWQTPRECHASPSERCEFLGIDHSAITVSDTDASLRLYRDTLGLKVAGESENYGVEQEHLNGVFGAHLRITTLRAPSDPGIELLEYLSPRGGRSAPKDARANDIAHWQIEFEAPSISTFATVTPPLARRVFTTAHAVIVRDRDGHALRLRDSQQNAR
jgi:catechol 2,3-dioxygenase-like lactoylglutathione lyase family enzyme